MMSLAKKTSCSVTASVLIMIIAQATGAQKVEGSQKPATLRIVSHSPVATVFVRTGGHNGFAEIGKTPLALKDVQAGLLGYTLLRTDRQLHDGSLWIEPGQEHVEEVALSPGRVFFVDQKEPKAADSSPGTEQEPWKTMHRACEVMVAADCGHLSEELRQARATDNVPSLSGPRCIRHVGAFAQLYRLAQQGSCRRLSG